MSEEDKKLQKHLVDEMMKVYGTNPDVMLYMESLMENYEKLEQENQQLKKRNKEIYEGFMVAIDEVCETERERIKIEKKVKKAIEWVHKHISKYNCKGITIIDWDELSNPNDLLEILGDKENE